MADRKIERDAKGRIIKNSPTPPVPDEVKERSGIEVGDNQNPHANQPDDFFAYPSKKPGFYYHWAKNDPRRIHELRRKGYEIDPASSSKDAAGRVATQKEYLRKQINDTNLSREDRDAAGEILRRMEDTPVDTITNIPEHVMMRTPVENRRKIEQKRRDHFKNMDEAIERDKHDLIKALRRSGKGGLRELQDILEQASKR